LQDFLVVRLRVHLRVQLLDHGRGVRTPYVVALQQHLRATARAHDFAAELFKTRVLRVRAHQEHERAAEKKEFA
jgi:hypothetical protein